MNIEAIIKNAIIKKSQPLGFDEFMDLALYYPSMGYYSCGLEKFGAQGDFITAPETSDLFGFCLARQCTQVLDGENDILEFGAGSGVLAAQILFELARLDKLPKIYYILELSAELKHRQQQTIRKALPELTARVVWLDALPKSFSGVVIANEVLDAMPAKRLICRNDKFYELGVDYQADKFVWKMFAEPYQSTDPLPVGVADGYVTETNIRASAWVSSLSAILDEALVLLIDYGMDRGEYFHPQRGEGTLRCYYQHQASDNPFVNIGKQDITTSVNFSQIAQQADASGLEVCGYATQAMFLISLGIDEYLSRETDENKRVSLSGQLKHLILPNAMGESFKVLALGKKISVKLNGFQQQNLRHKL